jgi:hypothetical protein
MALREDRLSEKGEAIMSVIGPAAASPRNGPRPPEIATKDILGQFWVDLYGKEVQSASTYSYMWMADQMGHVCLGIVIDFALTLALGYALLLFGIATGWDEIGGLALGVTAVSYWEYRAYRSSVAGATGLFPLDSNLLRNNAVIAAAYMAIGVGAGFAFHQTALWGVAGFLALMLVGVVSAPPWLRQKIIWQKAALPYLFRLADAQRTIGTEAAQRLQALIDRGAPPATPPYQVIVGGPIGSGRSSIAAGIGTEFAFKKTKVRYLSMDTLLECAVQPPNPDFADDTGPANIGYWRWSEAQVVIIDDIGPLIATQEQARQANLERFRKLLRTDLAAVASVLAKCHTVWVIGDLRPGGQTTMVGSVLDDFAHEIAGFCNAQQPALVIELSEIQKPVPVDGGRPAVEGQTRPAQLRNVTR